MQPLPIDEVLPEVLAALGEAGAVVLVAPPGAGKTTRVPAALLDAGVEGRVLCLQPRRVAARAAARRIAAERGVRLGKEVGYTLRFDAKTSADTRLELLTEGLLTRRLQSDPFLEGVGAVVLDEFHERSLHVDLALALLREVQREARPELRLVVMSATLDPGPVAEYLGCPVVRSEGRAFPVEVTYAAQPSKARIHERCAAAVRRLRPERGHLLAFLPGVGEIERCAGALRDLPEVHPLHGRLRGEQQDAALAPSTRPKIVLATNIAETSVTMEGVRVVVDSGLRRAPRFDAAIGLERLELGRISLASADQRAGRAGRTGPGACHRLWTRGEHRGLSERETPALRRVDLARTVLEIRAWGADPSAFEWFEAPPEASLAHADALLRRLGALDRSGVTALGRRLLRLPLHPRLGRVVVAGVEAGILGSAAAAAAIASEKDVFREPPRYSGDSDLQVRLEALERAAEGRFDQGVDRGAARTLLRVRDQLVRVAGGALGRRAEAEELAHLLLCGFGDRVARRRAPNSERFLLASGMGATLDRQSRVREAELILAIGLSGGRRGERAEHRIRVASAIEEAWLEVETREETRFDPERQAVVTEAVRRFGAIVLDARPTKASDPGARSACLAEAVAVDPSRALSLDGGAGEWLGRLRWLAGEMPELGLPTFEELEPEAGPGPLIQSACAGRRSFAELRKAPLLSLMRGLAGHQVCATLDRLAPASLTLPTGRSRRLDYQPGKAPILAARIQQLFGWNETPRVADGRVPVMLHLLAPNMRPAQITRDLAGFWERTWPQVRKELRGRYPKHDWPVDPRR